MTTEQLSDRLIDAYDLYSGVNGIARNIRPKLDRAMISTLKEKARQQFIACLRELRHESFTRRGILPHGQNGRLPLFPDGTRPHTEVADMTEELLKIIKEKPSRPTPSGMTHSNASS